jgi:transposase-like protein
LHIIAGILSLAQHIRTINDKLLQPRLKYCLCCGKANPRLHGSYHRKADRSGNQDESLNPVYIQRYYCTDCRRTCSVLPECMPPRRWYLWETQQATLVLVLSGKSLRAIARESLPSRHTIGRWVSRLKVQFHLHKDALCQHIADLGRTTGLADFWQACFSEITLSKAMCLCYAAGVPIP